MIKREVLSLFQQCAVFPLNNTILMVCVWTTMSKTYTLLLKKSFKGYKLTPISDCSVLTSKENYFSTSLKCLKVSKAFDFSVRGRIQEYLVKSSTNEI